LQGWEILSGGLDQGYRLRDGLLLSRRVFFRRAMPRWVLLHDPRHAGSVQGAELLPYWLAEPQKVRRRILVPSRLVGGESVPCRKLLSRGDGDAFALSHQLLL
jgi:hypothetical protein